MAQPRPPWPHQPAVRGPVVRATQDRDRGDAGARGIGSSEGLAVVHLVEAVEARQCPQEGGWDRVLRTDKGGGAGRS